MPLKIFGSKSFTQMDLGNKQREIAHYFIMRDKRLKVEIKELELEVHI